MNTETQIATDRRTKEVAGPGTLDKKREAVLQEALKAFAHSGFEGTSIRAIAKAVGIKHQNIAHYFGSKEDLWDAALDYEIERHRELQVDYGFENDERDPREQFRSEMRAFITMFAKRASIFQIYVREGMQNGPRYRKLLERHISRHESNARGALERGQEAGAVRTDIPMDDFIYVFKGALLYRYLVPAESEYFTGLKVDDPAVIEAHTEAITQLFLKP